LKPLNYSKIKRFPYDFYVFWHDIIDVFNVVPFTDLEECDEREQQAILARRGEKTGAGGRRHRF